MTFQPVKILRGFLLSVAIFCTTIVILLHIPTVQHQLSVFVSQQLGKQLNAELSIGQIAYSFPNRIIIDDVILNDQEDKEMVKIARVSAKFQLMQLFTEGRISIHTAQLFGTHLHLRRATPTAPLNMQFVIDAFASKDTTDNPSNLDLRINSLLIRRGTVCYDVESVPESPGKFNTSHLDFKQFNATLSLKAFRNDSINATIKRMEFQEKSGLQLVGLNMKLLANEREATLKDFKLQLPESMIEIGMLHANYASHTNEKGEVKLDSLTYWGGITQNSHFVLRDLSPIIPDLQNFKEPLRITATIEGTNEDLTLNYLRINSAKNDIRLDLSDVYTTFPLNRSAEISATLKEINLSRKGADILYQNLQTANSPTPAALLQTAPIKLTAEMAGTLEELNLLAFLQTHAGNVEANAIVYDLHDTQATTFQGIVYSDRFDLSPLNKHPEGPLGEIAFNLQAKGESHDSLRHSLYLQGDIPLLQYEDYEYHNIHADGTLDSNGFNGLLAIEDPNISLNVNGQFNPTGRIPVFNLTAHIKHFRPHELNLSENYKGCEYGFNLTAQFQGNNLDNIDGEVNIDSLTAVLPHDFYFMDNFNVRARTLKDKKKQITIDADFMKASIEGTYAYATLPTSLTHLFGKYLPALFEKQQTQSYRAWKKRPNNNLTLNATLYNSNFYSYVLNIPLKINPFIQIKGYINDLNNKIKLEGYAPDFTYNDAHYESALLRCENTDKQITANLNISKQMQGKSMVNLSVQAQAAENHLATRLSWGNNTTVTYSGKIEAETDFSRTPGLPSYLHADIRVKPTELIMNDTIWNLHESTICIDSGKVAVNDFMIEHEDQHIYANGLLTDNPQDSLIVDLKQIKVEYIMDILQFHPVDFTGSATGKAYVSSALGTPQADTRLFIKDFHFNQGLMGDMNIYGRWDNDEGLYLDADIREKDISHTTVQGYVSPQKKGLDLHIGADSTNLAFLNSFVGNIFSDISGRTSGDIHLHGTFKELNLEGDVIADAHAKVDVLNAQFNLRRDSVHLRTDGIYFPNTIIYDPEGHRGIVNGHLKHTHLKDMSYDFDIHTEGMLFYNTKKFSEDLPFYGSIYGTGDIRLWGGGNTLRVQGHMQTNKNTLFVYNLSTPDELTNSEFITFVDKTPRWKPIEVANPFAPVNNEEEEEEESDPLNLFINAELDVTNDANVRVIMDTQSGDYVSVYGGGEINVNYNNGPTDIRGIYTCENGIYKMSMQELIRKDFIIQSGSQVSFSGKGEEAGLDLKAVYTVNSASLSDLIPDATFNQNTVKVNCIINMTGTLASPALSFDLELPTVNDEERELVRSAISTDEQMKMQIIYLLGIGKFYTYDYANTEGRSSSDAMSSLLSSTLSGQLNNILSQALNMNNWNFSSNFSTGQEGWSDLEVEGILSGRLLNNRLLINGNFGYRENQLANSNFVGDFNIQWLLTPSGNIRLKAYNMTNDRYFAKTTFNTQGLGIIYKREFNSWRDLFGSWWWKKKEK